MTGFIIGLFYIDYFYNLEGMEITNMYTMTNGLNTILDYK